MATTTRFLTTSSSSSSASPLRLNQTSSSSSSSVGLLSLRRCLTKAGMVGEKRVLGNVVVKASVGVILTEPETKKSEGIDLASLVGDVAIKILRPMVRRPTFKQQAEAVIDKAVIDCRFFSLFAVAGSLLGSILCFVEGCFLILDSYFQYFQTMSQRTSDDGHVVQLLIEATDMFLLGSALLMFGMGLYVMFVGAKNLKTHNGVSNLFGIFPGKRLPVWLDMQCVSQAKTRIGHAIMMILQVGVMEKVKNIPLVSAIDLACFAGAILVSSLTIFILSRLSTGGT
ncbi:hypothetical protein GIB67_005417 [Kingdonia uniflora]|uniref:Uncharacterized protein n=1 Tax=Kingdonia uniflora TaxID=39325 RepID=A0A7J7NH93_9MAGN|nr:hypothetical protein GIB67_005417 [Kingdonia uniflora]